MYIVAIFCIFASKILAIRLLRNLQFIVYRLIHILLFTSIYLVSLANPVTIEEARSKARAFLQKKGKEIADLTPVMKKQRNHAAKPYYVFNATNNEGFVIICGDDSQGDILGYANKGTFDENAMPDNIRFWLGNFSNNTTRKDSKGVGKKSGSQHEAIDPLISTTWGQGEATEQGKPYNMLCPVVDGRHCITGCVATSMAQVMNYHQWPEEACSVIPSYFSNDIIGQLDALPQLDFDWENMKGSYNGTEDEQEKMAVAQLMRYCGQAAITSYNLEKSEAYGSNAANALKQYFGYSPNIRLVRAAGASREKWEQMIYHELSSSRPVIYFGSSSTSTHCFICDGYDNDGFFHINWGWNGRCDGFFDLSLLNPDEKTTEEGLPDGFSTNVSAIIGISKHVLSSEIIPFADPQVKAICLQQWDTNGDQELSRKEADAVISIDDAFRGNSTITEFEELRYFQNLRNIAAEAFAGCNNLSIIRLPSQIRKIKDRAFYGCSALESIFIPRSVEQVSKDAFIGCTSLNNIKVASENMKYDSRQNCNAIIETETNTLLLGCGTTVIPEGVTTIGESAFEGCTQLQLVNLPQSTTALADRCFYGCSQLREIALPQDLTSIGSKALAECTEMSTIYSYNIVPPAVEPDAFEGTNPMLLVPSGTKTAYQSDEVWNQLLIEEMQSEYIMECAPVTFKRDKGGVLVLSMSNKKEVIGFQIRLTLPKGMSVRQQDDELDIHLSRRASDHTLHCTQQSDGSYIILAMSMSLKPLSGNEGELLSIAVEADDSIAAGTHEALFSDMTISIINQQVIMSIYPMPFTGTMTIKDHDLGDANHDGYINVTDVMMIVNHILGNVYTNFHEEEADLDHNGRIDVTDALRVVQIIIDQEVEAPLLAPCSSMEAYLISTAPRTTTLHLDNIIPCTAMQLTVSVPANCMIKDVHLNDSRSQGHNICTEKIGNGKYKVVIFNLDGLPFRDMDTALLDIETSTPTTDIKVENIVCTTTLCETLACHDINGLSDGITSLPYEEETSQSPSYNLAGQQVNSHYKGIVIQNGKKRMRK